MGNPIRILLLAIMGGIGLVHAADEFRSFSVPGGGKLNPQVEFLYRLPGEEGTRQGALGTRGMPEEGTKAQRHKGTEGNASSLSNFPNLQPNRLQPTASLKVLLLVHGYGSKAEWAMSQEWCRFADEQGLVLLAPTFKVDMKEVEAKKGYYYPALWSGVCVEAALAELAKREKVSVDKIFVFGMSGGAHFAHRFAAWKPSRVKAFVAYSAGWWDPPSPKMKDVPGLVMCGEEDLRVQPTLNYYLEVRKLDLPVVWRSYRGTGHELTPAVQAMSQAFLAHYAQDQKDEPWIGDIQTYVVHPIQDKENIPEPVQCILPSKAVAEAWTKE